MSKRNVTQGMNPTYEPHDNRSIITCIAVKLVLNFQIKCSLPLGLSCLWPGTAFSTFYAGQVQKQIILIIGLDFIKIKIK